MEATESPAPAAYPEPAVYFFPKPRRVRGVQIIPAPELKDHPHASGNVLWPVKAVEVFSVLGIAHYLIRDHSKVQNKPDQWSVVVACGMAVCVPQPGRQQAVDAAVANVTRVIARLGPDAYRELVAKAKAKCAAAAIPLPEVYLHPSRL